MQNRILFESIDLAVGAEIYFSRVPSFGGMKLSLHMVLRDLCLRNGGFILGSYLMN